MVLPSFPALRALVVAAALCFSAVAVADTLQDAQRLLKQGQLKEALDRTEQVIASKPKDAQARFLKGVILTEMNRTADAVTVFTKLTEDYPELPEPYNNLAVLYAQQRQYDKAKNALEMAIRTHPAYATAYENLGDIYARMASQAYDKALQLDSSNAGAQAKLAMIRDLMGGSARAATPARAAPAKPSTPAPAALPAAPVESKPAPEARPAPESKAPEPKAAEKTQQVAKAKPAEEPKAAADADLVRMVDDWAAAWSRKDVKSYLSFYSKDFRTPAGQSRAAWEASRAQRIHKPGAIQVTVENVRAALEAPDRAMVKFRQHYRSAGLKTSSNKTLVFVKRDGKWQIQQERVGS